MREPLTSGGSARISQPSQPGNPLPMVQKHYTAGLSVSTHVGGTERSSAVTETSTHSPWKASVMPVKLPATGIT